MRNLPQFGLEVLFFMTTCARVSSSNDPPPVNRKASSNDAQGLCRDLGDVEHAGALAVAAVVVVVCLRGCFAYCLLVFVFLLLGQAYYTCLFGL